MVRWIRLNISCSDISRTGVRFVYIFLAPILRSGFSLCLGHSIDGTCLKCCLRLDNVNNYRPDYAPPLPFGILDRQVSESYLYVVFVYPGVRSLFVAGCSKSVEMDKVDGVGW